MRIASRLTLYACPTCLKRSLTNPKSILYSTVFIRLASSVSHYEVLNVPKTASQLEIKKAFFEKSKKFHPDVSPDNPNHHQMFVKISNAYSVLGDKAKRKDYDQSLKPKKSIYTHQRNEELHKYRQNASYVTKQHGSVDRNSKPSHSDNIKVALAALTYMICGATLCFFVIGYRHKKYKKQLDITSMKASKLYQESRERSSKYTMKEQLEMLAERQGKIEPKRSSH